MKLSFDGQTLNDIIKQLEGVIVDYYAHRAPEAPTKAEDALAEQPSTEPETPQEATEARTSTRDARDYTNMSVEDLDAVRVALRSWLEREHEKGAAFEDLKNCIVGKFTTIVVDNLTPEHLQGLVEFLNAEGVPV